MKSDLFAGLKEKTVLFDGAMGTMLMAAGLKSGEAPELWNFEKPSVVMDIHRRYYEAGSDVVQTNTFGGTPLKLGDKGLADKAHTLNREAAKLVRNVCPAGRFVAGDIGPTGKMIKPLGEVSREEMEETFFIQARALVDGGVDLISIETMFSLEEALAAVRAARQASNLPLIAGVTFQNTKNGFFTMMGEGVDQCVTALEAAGVDVIASNCTLGSHDMIPLTRELREATKKPILIQPNAGKPVLREGITRFEQTPEEFAKDCKAIRDAGADMIGGCCGTDDEFIRALAQALV
jgi:5-methyltetrahydrofolate--homocysteine methyltransferase